MRKHSGKLWPIIGLALMLSTPTAGFAAEPVQCNEARPPSPADAVKSMVDGNERWSSGNTRHSGRDFARRECTAEKGQTPFAAVVACSDSRVPPELLFDEGVGDLFVVRVAGNSVDKVGAQSLAYSAEVLGVETIFVMGHQHCGAVKAAIGTYPAKAPEFLKLIYGAVAKAKEALMGKPEASDKAAIEQATIDQHVILTVKELRQTAPFKAMVDAGKLSIVGGRYDLDAGKVTMLIQ